MIPLVVRIGVPVIAMTGTRTSTLARVARVVLDVGVEQEACPLQLAPTSSTTAMLAMGDALAMVLLERRGFTREEFAMFHPAGSLGRTLLLRVDEVMRGLDRMSMTPAGALVGDAVIQMGRMRCGCSAIVDDEGVLMGLFTHGDFARCYAKDRLIGERVIGTVMTRDPIVVRSGALAVEAVRILEDDRRRVCGLVDSQDLARWKLV